MTSVDDVMPHVGTITWMYRRVLYILDVIHRQLFMTCQKWELLDVTC